MIEDHAHDMHAHRLRHERDEARNERDDLQRIIDERPPRRGLDAIQGYELSVEDDEWPGCWT